MFFSKNNFLLSDQYEFNVVSIVIPAVYSVAAYLGCFKSPSLWNRKLFKVPVWTKHP